MSLDPLEYGRECAHEGLTVRWKRRYTAFVAREAVEAAEKRDAGEYAARW
jgi:hypothetical protein